MWHFIGLIGQRGADLKYSVQSLDQEICILYLHKCSGVHGKRTL